MTSYIQVNENKIRIQLFVQPKSSKTSWDGLVERDESIWVKLRVSSPPVDGAANKEIQKFLAKEFKAAKTNVRIVQGEKSRLKILELTGADDKKVQAFLKAFKPANSVK